MRNIYDILEELRQHPDCISLNVWTRDMIIDHLVSGFESDILFNNPHLDDIDINLEIDDLKDDDWWEIGRQLEAYYETCIDDPIDLGQIGDLEKRLRRKISLDQLLKGD